MAYKEDKYDELIAKFLAGDISSPEKEDLMAWTNESDANREYFDSMVSLWDHAEDPEPTFFDNDLEDAWTGVAKATKPQTGGGAKIRPLRGPMFRMRIAAVLLIGLGLSLWALLRQEPAAELLHFATSAGEQLELVLPDSSRVLLNEHSSLSYAEDFKERQVTLSGEGYFDITHQDGARFEIFSQDAVTTVLGTSFYVRAYPEEARVSVTVVSGKVALAKKDQETEPLLLEAGDAGVLETGAESAVSEEVADLNEKAWHTNRLQFDDQVLLDIIPVLESVYQVEIELEDPAIGNCHFTGIFEAYSIEQIIEILSYTLRTEVSQDGNTYRLSGEGCR